MTELPVSREVALVMTTAHREPGRRRRAARHSPSVTANSARPESTASRSVSVPADRWRGRSLRHSSSARLASTLLGAAAGAQMATGQPSAKRASMIGPAFGSPPGGLIILPTAGSPLLCGPVAPSGALP